MAEEDLGQEIEEDQDHLLGEVEQMIEVTEGDHQGTSAEDLEAETEEEDIDSQLLLKY